MSEAPGVLKRSWRHEPVSPSWGFLLGVCMAWHRGQQRGTFTD